MYCGRGDGSDFSVEVDQVATSEQLLRKNVDFSSLFLRLTRLKIFRIGVAEVGRWHGGPTLKSLDSDENFKPEHTLFCCDLRTFWRSLGKKKAFLGQIQCFLGKTCTFT